MSSFGVCVIYSVSHVLITAVQIAVWPVSIIVTMTSSCHSNVIRHVFTMPGVHAPNRVQLACLCALHPKSLVC